jgi:GDP/UDP-N,N'-diacetylbacillosamine 2-epimerase (hydrolysing)
MNRKICVITGSRADYGLLKWVMQGIKDDPDLHLQIIATGMHLSPLFGLTYKAIEDDGFSIDVKLDNLGPTDSPLAISESMGLTLTGITSALEVLKPDLIVVLGDRFEIFASTAAALISRIPVAHLNGGEVTIGAMDESFRHSITKMSHLHFVATEEYKSRVIQLGENPSNVFLVGGTGIDNIVKFKLLSRDELENVLDIDLGKKSLLVTFHPATLSDGAPQQQIEELLSALSTLIDTTLIFTMPNADTGGHVIKKLIDEFVLVNKNAKAFASLGQVVYLSCLAQVDGVVGNSSSGLTEAPSFRKGTINIGERQLGRIQASSIINCGPNANEIKKAIEILYSEDFKTVLGNTKNPYGEGGASAKIVEILKACSLDGITRKAFHDL